VPHWLTDTDRVPETPAYRPPEAPAARGLNCYRCGYDLTGLPQSRCPECGIEFEWDDPRLIAEFHRGVAFEKARTIRGFAWGFVLTWLTVLFAPWIFARQALRRVSVGRGLIFAGICFLSTLGAYFHEPGWDIIIAWIVTAAIYMPAQALALSLADRAFYRRPGATLSFWLAVTGYTSAIMIVETIVGGPPFVLLFDVMYEVFGVGSPGNTMMSELYQLRWGAGLSWAMFAVWLAELACCYLARARANGVAGSTILVVTPLVIVGLATLYALVLQFIGAPLAFELVGSPLNCAR
jgi:hypothetical protein